MGDAVSRRPDDRCCVHEGTAGKYKDIEERDGKKGICVNIGKTKIMESDINLDVLMKSGKHPCGVCQTGVGSSWDCPSY